jgi:exo-1,4-beta-D-glucosaminidase
MKKTLINPAGLPVFFLVLPLTVFSQDIKQIKLTRFDLQSSYLVKAEGAELSLTGYKKDIYWFPVEVPSTVLTGLVKNGVYPDPYSGMNNMLIPDASDEFNKTYDLEKYSHLPNDPNPWKKPYWYRTVFDVTGKDNGRVFQLIFKGINYRAEVWLNGSMIADSSQMAGMFAQYAFDVTKSIIAGKQNALAVKIYPLDYPGLPSQEQLKAFDDFYPNGGPTGDIGKNVTMLCSVGWDWMPPVRDRNMGIWLPVYLRTTGNVTVADPKIVTNLNLPDTSSAEISVNVHLKNHGGKDENGSLNVAISPENFTGETISFSKDVNLKANSTAEINLDPGNTKELELKNPALWWPNGYGKPGLYRIKLSYEGNEGISDDTSFVFGIRTVDSKVEQVKNSYRRDFYVNGRRIHITGGAWVPDMMLNRDSLRYDYEMRLCRNANINLVRIWGGGVTPCDEFFDAADRYGLLVWSDFWITGDTQGQFKGSPDWPLEGDVFARNVKSTILRIRNHPSLLVWTGGNEGHARKELYDVMRNSVITLDGTRPFIPSSSGFAVLPEGYEGSWPDNMPAGVYSGGPYTWQDPKSYYSKAIAGNDWVFKDETGLPSQPPYNIMSRIIPNLIWDRNVPFPLNNTWGYHDAATGNGKWDLYYKEMISRYGEPASMEEFCNKMQLMNAMGYQGIFEAAGHRLNDIGGVMLWKLNAAFPSVVWQVYDWYLMPNAGYYFMQNAVEPVHAQLNVANNRIQVINRTYSDIRGLSVTTDIFDVKSTPLFHDIAVTDLPATTVKSLTDLSFVINSSDALKFVVLTLKDMTGNVISGNTYWLSGKNDFKPMNSMERAVIDVDVEPALGANNNLSWRISLVNTSNKLAFFIRPQLMVDEEEILPSYWTAGYFSIAPSESRAIMVTCPAGKISGKQAELRISGWNVPEIRKKIQVIRNQESGK